MTVMLKIGFHVKNVSYCDEIFDVDLLSLQSNKLRVLAAKLLSWDTLEMLNHFSKLVFVLENKYEVHCSTSKFILKAKMQVY